MPGDALAECEVHPLGMVDDDPQALRRDALAGEQLDVGLGPREPALNVCLDRVVR